MSSLEFCTIRNKGWTSLVRHPQDLTGPRCWTKGGHFWTPATSLPGLATGPPTSSPPPAGPTAMLTPVGSHCCCGSWTYRAALCWGCRQLCAPHAGTPCPTAHAVRWGSQPHWAAPLPHTGWPRHQLPVGSPLLCHPCRDPCCWPSTGTLVLQHLCRTMEIAGPEYPGYESFSRYIEAEEKSLA